MFFFTSQDMSHGTVSLVRICWSIFIFTAVSNVGCLFLVCVCLFVLNVCMLFTIVYVGCWLFVVVFWFVCLFVLLFVWFCFVVVVVFWGVLGCFGLWFFIQSSLHPCNGQKIIFDRDSRAQIVTLHGEGLFC